MRCQPIKPIGSNISFINKTKQPPIEGGILQKPTDDTAKSPKAKNNDR